MTFPTTHWSQVMQAGAAESHISTRALSQLYETYYFPLYLWARVEGSNPEDSEDLAQGFFKHLLQRRPFGEMRPENGRFRSFLKVAFKNFRVTEFHKGAALKRGGNFSFVPMDSKLAEKKLASESSGLTPEEQFDKAWARQVLETALKQTRLHYSALGKDELFLRLKGCLQGELGISYSDLAKELGKTEAALKVEAMRLRKKFAEIFRSIVTQTVRDESEMEAEVRYLLGILARG